MSTRRTSAIALAAVAAAAVAGTGLGSVLSASAAQSRSSRVAKVGSVYVHRIGHDSTKTAIRIPRTRQTGAIAPVTVPAGSYLVTFTGHFSRGSETDAFLYCSLAFVGKKTTYGNGFSVAVNEQNAQVTGSEQETVTFRKPGRIGAYCGTSSGNEGSTAGLGNAELTALAVTKVRSFR